MRRRPAAALAAAVTAAAGLVMAEIGAGGLGYGSGKLHDPCEPRQALKGGGPDRGTQRALLRALDELACRAGKSREELVLDLARRGVDVVELARRVARVLDDED